MQLKRLNLSSKGKQQPLSDRQFISRFIELQLKELGREDLTTEDVLFLAHAELAASVVPGALEDALLEYALPENAGESYRVAAATGASLYDQVWEAIQEGTESFHLQINGISVLVLRIDAIERRVEPLFVDGYSYWVSRRSGAPEEVGRYGGIFLSLEDLRGMVFTYDSATKTIRLAPIQEA